MVRARKLLGITSAGALFLCLKVTAAQAQDIVPMPEPAMDYVSMSLLDLGEQLRAITDNSDDCREMVPIFSEVFERRPDITELAPALYSAQMRCALERNAFADALQHFEDWESVGAPPPPIGLYLAGAAEDGPKSVMRLEAILLSSDETMLSSLRLEYVRPALRAARKANLSPELERISAIAIEAGALDHIDQELHSELASNALSVAAARQDLTFAEQLLDYVDYPLSYTRLLGMREFEPIWPAVEARVGSKFEAITSSFRESMMAAWDTDQGDSDAMREVAYALYFEGDLAGVIDFVDAATARDDLAATLVEDETWALNLKAYSLDALGRTAEADAVFEMIGQGDRELRPGLVNFAINRGSRLVRQGRWEEGLEAAEYAAQIAEEDGSPFARSLTLRDRICALDGLGRTDETTQLLENLHTEAEDLPGLRAQGLLCLGRDDEAAEVIVDGLSKETTREQLIEDMQPEAFEMFYTHSILPKMRDLMATHPEIREAFLEHARVIPEQFYPAASLVH